MSSRTRRFANLQDHIKTNTDGTIQSITADKVTSSSASINTLNGDDATFTGNVGVQGKFGSVQALTGNAAVNASDFVTTIIHTGTGTVTVPTSGWPTGAQLNVVTNGTCTLDWGTDAVGVSLGNSMKMASGTFDGSKWFYSEASS